MDANSRAAFLPFRVDPICVLAKSAHTLALPLVPRPWQGDSSSGRTAMNDVPPRPKARYRPGLVRPRAVPTAPNCCAGQVPTVEDSWSLDIPPRELDVIENRKAPSTMNSIVNTRPVHADEDDPINRPYAKLGFSASVAQIEVAAGWTIKVDRLPDVRIEPTRRLRGRGSRAVQVGV
jgi:hypothetical protein